MTEGGVHDSINAVKTTKDHIMYLSFSHENGLLHDSHPIIRGNNSTSKVDRIFTFFGQALTVPEGAAILLKLSATSQDFKASSKIENIDGKIRRSTDYIDPISAAGKAQGLAFAFGTGRVVILGEAAMLTAQLLNDRKFGMNVPGSSNRQFALNIVRWLTATAKE